MYCLFFIITFLTRKLDKMMKDKLQIGGGKLTLENVINIFTKPGINDELMELFRKQYLNKKQILILFFLHII